MPLARSDREPGGRGAGVGEMARELGTEAGSGAQADAFDLTETLDVLVEGWAVVEMSGELLLESGDLLFQGANEAGLAFGDGGMRGDLEAVAKGEECGLEGLDLAEELAQEELLWRGGLPERERLRGGSAEVGDEGSIDAVGLVAAATAASVVLDPARVGEMDWEAGGMKRGGGQFAIKASGLENGDRRSGEAELLGPSDERVEAGGRVGERTMTRAAIEEQTDIELVLGDVDAEGGGAGTSSRHEEEWS